MNYELALCEILQMKSILSDETKWTKGKLARNAEGHSVYPEDPDATCWCFMGAMLKAHRELQTNELSGDYLQEILRRPIASWNDSPTRQFEDIIAFLARVEKHIRDKFPDNISP